MFDRLSRLISALLAASQFGVSVTYSYKLLDLMDRLERGQLSEGDFAREGTKLTEMFPDDWKKGRNQVIRNAVQSAQPFTLDDIRHEATVLEIDMHIDEEGCLDLTKRGNPSLFYRSLHSIDDPRVVPDAWKWIQTYRANLQRIDEARIQLADQSDQHKRARIFWRWRMFKQS
jgi:hypothetical protein